jgi:hypothetical protein
MPPSHHEGVIVVVACSGASLIAAVFAYRSSLRPWEIGTAQRARVLIRLR